jgi:DNA transformation protein
MKRQATRKAKSAGSRKVRPMAVTSGFKQYILDQLEGLGDVTARAMFGGVGLYHRDLFFAILAGDTLYLKVDDRTRPDFEAAGMRPFKPYAHRPATFQYYEVPVGVIEAAPTLVEWARKAVNVRAAESSVSGTPDRSRGMGRRTRTSPR